MKHLTNIIDIEQTITDTPTDDGLFPEDALADAEEPGTESPCSSWGLSEGSSPSGVFPDRNWQITHACTHSSDSLGKGAFLWSGNRLTMEPLMTLRELIQSVDSEQYRDYRYQLESKLWGSLQYLSLCFSKYDWYAKEPDALTEMHVLCIAYRLGLFHHKTFVIY